MLLWQECSAFLVAMGLTAMLLSRHIGMELHQLIRGLSHGGNWWMNFFKDMIDRDIVNTANPLRMECLWFCFSSVLQKELDSIKEHWNSHYIRHSRHNTIAGKPDVLYHLPESVGAESHIKPVTELQVEDMSQYCEDAQEVANDYQEYFIHVCDNEIRISSPTNWRESTELYDQLIRIAVAE